MQSREECHGIDLSALIDQLSRVYINCPLHIDPWDRHIGGRRDLSLRIWVDMSLYSHACIGGPLQNAL